MQPIKKKHGDLLRLYLYSGEIVWPESAGGDLGHNDLFKNYFISYNV